MFKSPQTQSKIDRSLVVLWALPLMGLTNKPADGVNLPF